MPAPSESSRPIDSRHRVAVLALPGVIPFELGIPSRVFDSARLEPDAGHPNGRKLYRVATCSPYPPGTPLSTSTDFRVVADHGPELLEEADTVIVPATYELEDLFENRTAPPEWAAALSRIRPGARLVSICTGAFVLAAAGLLDGRRATTHWMHTDLFARLFPQVLLDPDVLFVDDGDVLTSAGVASGMDLCLYVLRRDHGSAVANSVARRCVVPPWRDGGQAQYVERPVPEAAGSGSTAEARAWVLTRLEQPPGLRELAERAHLSVRTFTRRFRSETGMSYGEWLAGQRLERARELLERRDGLTVEQVAREAGFGTGASLRKHMSASLRVSPAQYRRTFGT
ncbi:GlxA family transcriptional regulator [Mangrovactinospora gilvigrisea]|nr:helix-turn-helix domain-containing protein [Mangrovactinospora gilvigrisea]